LGPLINTTFKRYAVAEIYDDHRLRNVKKHNRQQPEEQVGLAEFRGGSNPTRADHKQNLCQHQIAQGPRLFQGDAVVFNVAFCTIDFDCHSWTVAKAAVIFPRHPERSAAEFEGSCDVTRNHATGLIDFARNDFDLPVNAPTDSRSLFLLRSDRRRWFVSK